MFGRNFVFDSSLPRNGRVRTADVPKTPAGGREYMKKKKKHRSGLENRYAARRQYRSNGDTPVLCIIYGRIKRVTTRNDTPPGRNGAPVAPADDYYYTRNKIRTRVRILRCVHLTCLRARVCVYSQLYSTRALLYNDDDHELKNSDRRTRSHRRARARDISDCFHTKTPSRPRNSSVRKFEKLARRRYYYFVRIVFTVTVCRYEETLAGHFKRDERILRAKKGTISYTIFVR